VEVHRLGRSWESMRVGTGICNGSAAPDRGRSGARCGGCDELVPTNDADDDGGDDPSKQSINQSINQSIQRQISRTVKRAAAQSLLNRSVPDCVLRPMTSRWEQQSPLRSFLRMPVPSFAAFPLTAPSEARGYDFHG